ncbi:MAG: sialate O-acetylesterase [Thiolinea sp.]
MKTSIITILTGMLVILCGSPLSAAERIYLMAGQSNMMGLASTENLSASYKSTPANVQFFYKGSRRQLAQDKHFGPEVSFAHIMANTFPEDQHIIVKFAATGSHIRQWFPGEPFYEGMLRQLGFSVPRKNPPIAAIFWMQGEGDSFNHERASTYAQNLTYFIYSLRKALNAPDTPFIMGEINPVGRDFPEVPLVQQQQREVNASVDNTHLIPERGIKKIYDNIHFNADGMVEMGRRYAQHYIGLIRRNSGQH